MTEKRENLRNSKPVSLFPLKPEEALKLAMSAQSPPKKKRPAKAKKAR